jgi:hypothetical protein
MGYNPPPPPGTSHRRKPMRRHLNRWHDGWYTRHRKKIWLLLAASNLFAVVIAIERSNITEQAFSFLVFLICVLNAFRPTGR